MTKEQKALARLDRAFRGWGVNILRIPNDEHVAKVMCARRAAGLPVNVMVHPFARIWRRRRVA